MVVGRRRKPRPDALTVYSSPRDGLCGHPAQETTIVPVPRKTSGLAALAADAVLTSAPVSSARTAVRIQKSKRVAVFG